MGIFTFPNPVNDKVARTVATCVIVLDVAALATGATWLAWVLAAGFALRTAFGPRIDPFAVLASRVIAPRLGAAKIVPGPPKRFAQAVGLAFTLAAGLCWSLGAGTAAIVLLAVLLVPASLEAFAGFCVGCWMFAGLMRAGVIPASVCLSCANVAYES